MTSKSRRLTPSVRVVGSWMSPTTACGSKSPSALEIYERLSSVKLSSSFCRTIASSRSTSPGSPLTVTSNVRVTLPDGASEPEKLTVAVSLTCRSCVPWLGVAVV